MNPVTKISGLSKLGIILAAILLAGSIFFPIWKIELFAPQYPEGLVLYINANGLTGNVDIINGLNHYIGMATLHNENFIEFSILTYILAGISICMLVTALIGKKRGLYILFGGFVLFSIAAMIDFYRWNYNYGHNLDPHAAIQVPGMSYQPPILGFKQLLNFGAYSIPALGGVLYIASAVILLLATLKEAGVFSKLMKKKPIVPLAIVLCSMLATASCGQPGAKPIRLNKDECANCKMTVTEAPFATQIATMKGRQYVFDDISCMAEYVKENPQEEGTELYVADFCKPESFLNVHEAKLIASDSLRSPMRGNVAAFSSLDSMKIYQHRYNAKEISWSSLIK
jgi:copper chaperone NosL